MQLAAVSCCRWLRSSVCKALRLTSCHLRLLTTLRSQPELWLCIERAATGYVGLKNRGATCYMNSLLQSLYHVPAFQRAVHKIPTEHDVKANRRHTAVQHPAVYVRLDEGASSHESVALALQRVFYKLRTSNTTVGTRKLTKSFGWKEEDSFSQHDVQEFNRKLCDTLQEHMEGTSVEKEIPRLFRGQLKSFVKCLNVDVWSERVEFFYDLSLTVRGCKNLEEALARYIEPERLEGANRYFATGHGLQDADRSHTFSSFPPVLNLHLKRFEYDRRCKKHVKINDRFEFKDTIDLAPYMEMNPGHPELYQLHSVLVHNGNVHHGHYYAYIRPDTQKDTWYKFNDSRVAVASKEEAIESNFGAGEAHDQGNAYMLVYVKKDSVADLLKPLAEHEIPAHVREHVQAEDEAQLQIKVVTWKNLRQYQGEGLHDWHDVLMLQVSKTMTVDELKTTIRETADMQAPYSESAGKTCREQFAVSDYAGHFKTCPTAPGER